MSMAHIKSYRHKKATGKGLDVNEDMLLMASDEDRHLGIKERAAENYSMAYRDLLRSLGKKKFMKKYGEIINTRQAAALLLNAAKDAARDDDPLATALIKLLRQWGLSPDIDPVDDDAFEDKSNYKLSQVFTLLVDLCDEVRQLGGPPELELMCNAQDDLRKIASQLQKDGLRGNERTVRYFQEVVALPADINRGIKKAYRLLSMEKDADF